MGTRCTGGMENDVENSWYSYRGLIDCPLSGYRSSSSQQCSDKRMRIGIVTQNIWAVPVLKPRSTWMGALLSFGAALSCSAMIEWSMTSSSDSYPPPSEHCKSGVRSTFTKSRDAARIRHVWRNTGDSPAPIESVWSKFSGLSTFRARVLQPGSNPWDDDA